MTASAALETVASVLTFQPALYAKIKPTSSPVITIPRTIVAQFVWENSLMMFPPFVVTKKARAEKSDTIFRRNQFCFSRPFCESIFFDADFPA